MLALIPIAECTADKRSYGFRMHRGVLDVATYLKLTLGAMYAKRWVLEADIKGFFDNLSHDWVLKNIPMNKKILKEFLKAGFIENNRMEPTDLGVPQGGVISPVIANMSLDSLDQHIQKASPGCTLVRYADDFIVIGPDELTLRIKVWAVVDEFLKERGLELNREKTKITSIDQGFDFLGFQFKEFPDTARIIGYKKGIFLVQPSKKNIRAIRQKLKTIIEGHRNKPIYVMITKLNQILRGWAEHYRSTTTTRIFSSIGAYLFRKIWIRLKMRHRGTPLRQLRNRYFMSVKGNNWVLYGKDEKDNIITLFQIGWVTKQRHMCCQPLNPFLPENEEYFTKRINGGAKSSTLLAENKRKLAKTQKGVCPLCKNPLLNGEPLEVHHIKGRKGKGWNMPKNWRLLHKLCHEKVTFVKDPRLRAQLVNQGIIKDE
jgi:RNA-directed DNA polymerase